LAHTRSQRFNQYAKIKNELEAIDYKKTMAKYELQNINNQIAILNRDISSGINTFV
jgi:predicted  nucleic acid-binding Zn-ribbon protein